MKIIQNSNKEEASYIKEKIKENNGYCPCQLEKNENTKCICKNFLNQEEDGWCHCGLYYKEMD